MYTFCVTCVLAAPKPVAEEGKRNRINLVGMYIVLRLNCVLLRDNNMSSLNTCSTQHSVCIHVNCLLFCVGLFDSEMPVCIFVQYMSVTSVCA